LCLSSCGVYNFTGGDVGSAKTFQVNLFQNYATQNPGSTFEPGLDRDFQQALAVKVRFFNKTKEDVDFEQRFSFFFDYDATAQLNSVQVEAHEIIFERITQDIFNTSLADW